MESDFQFRHLVFVCILTSLSLLAFNSYRNEKKKSKIFNEISYYSNADSIHKDVPALKIASTYGNGINR